MKLSILQLKTIILPGIAMLASLLVAQTPNQPIYIEMNVKQGEHIRVDLISEAQNSSIHVKSGGYDTTIVAGTNWTGFIRLKADSNVMKISGNVVDFDCSNNNDKVTGINTSNNPKLLSLLCNNNDIESLDVSANTLLSILNCENNIRISSLDVSGNIELTYLNYAANNLPLLDISRNTKLTDIYCYGSNFTTNDLDRLYCSLPERQPNHDAKIFPIKNASSPNNSAVMATNKTNATAKNWKIKYFDGKNDIAQTSGNYDCQSVVSITNVSTVLTKIYPNPTGNLLNIEAQDLIQTLKIYNISGKMVIGKANVGHSATVDISELETGLYIVKIQTITSSSTHRIMKR